MAIGIMGGTFDPIHIGHLLISEYIREELGLSKILFTPTGDPPHKPDRITPAGTRFELVKKAVADNINFEVLSIEADRQGKTYTVDTVCELEKLYPGEVLFYIIGSDTLYQLNTWKDPWLLKDRVKFVVYNRGGDKLEVERQIKSLRDEFGLSFVLSKGPMLDISSTEIRKRIGTRKSIKYMIPDSIVEDVRSISIELEFDLTAIEGIVRERLGEKRFRHTIGVAEKAVELAIRYGADGDKAYFAALLHDLAKPLDHASMLMMAGDSGIIFDNDTLGSTDLLHGAIGAYISEKEIGIRDTEILDAIRYHTTGRPNMTVLEKVIYLADFIEPGRSFPGVDEIRKLSMKDLNEAVIAALESTIEHLNRSNRRIHRSTLESRDYLIMERNTEI